MSAQTQEQKLTPTIFHLNKLNYPEIPNMFFFFFFFFHEEKILIKIKKEIEEMTSG